MGLFQRALETYESHIRYTENRDNMEPMAPMGHMVTRADLEITLDSDGEFVIATAVEKTEPKIVIPVTEGSAGRTSAPCAHPLCEQIGYLLPQNEVKYKLYTEQLADWANSEYTHPKLKPVLEYVKNGTIVDDLAKCELIKLDGNGFPKNQRTMICWRIQGEQVEECWRDASLIEAFAKYSLRDEKGNCGLCLVTGEYTEIGSNHPKKIVSTFANAKLISSNDERNFTYRGRFTDAWQAAEVGYEASMKAHNALRWLIQEQSVSYGGRSFLTWNPKGKTVTQPTLPFRPAKPIWTPTDYKHSLKEILEGRKRNFEITDDIVVASFDAIKPKSGRLALTYYNEFQAYDFWNRMEQWDEICCWYVSDSGIQSPSLFDIIKYGFGKVVKRRKEDSHIIVDDGILRNQMQRLIVCRLGNGSIGGDIVRALVSKASHSHLSEGDQILRENILSTACAAIRKYRYDHLKEELSMALEPEKKDRSYQFGRLLAVMEKVELDTFTNGKYRQPNALRLQSAFCNRPMHTANILHKKLEDAYFRQLNKDQIEKYKDIIAQIAIVLSEEPFEQLDMPLKDSYLIGYYLQRLELKEHRNNNTEEK